MYLLVRVAIMLLQHVLAEHALRIDPHRMHVVGAVLRVVVLDQRRRPVDAEIVRPARLPGCRPRRSAGPRGRPRAPWRWQRRRSPRAWCRRRARRMRMTPPLLRLVEPGQRHALEALQTTARGPAPTRCRRASGRAMTACARTSPSRERTSPNAASSSAPTSRKPRVRMAARHARRIGAEEHRRHGHAMLRAPTTHAQRQMMALEAPGPRRRARADRRRSPARSCRGRGSAGCR